MSLIAFLGGMLIGNLMSGGGGDEEVTAIGSERGGGGDADDINAGRPWKGGADALVTIVEISDFECPFCSRVGPTLEQIEEEYGDRVKIVWRNNPLPMHPNAPLAHQAAMEVFEQGGSDKFWEYHDLLFANQRTLTRENLERWAEDLGGIDMGEFRSALDDEDHAAKVQEDQQWATSIDARGTPHFVINGQKIAGAQPFERFKEIIDQEMERAQALVDDGTPPAQVFAARFNEAFGDSAGRPGAAPSQPQQQQARPRPDPNAVYRVPIDGRPQMGRDDALVTIVEVSDFECPFCSRVQPTIAQIKEEYGNDVRFIWRNNPLPFHQNAGPVHQAAMEVFEQRGADKFWEFHDLVFANQGGIREDVRGSITSWAQQIGGINMAQLNAAIDNNEHQSLIQEDQRLAQSLGASGTPSFFINGRNLRGAQPFQAFKAVIDEELEKARERIANGTSRANLYAAIIEDGATTPQMIGGGGGGGDRPAAPPEPESYEIDVPDDVPSKGPANAPVVIQEFSDFECPFCSRVLPTLEQIEREYGDQVRIVWRNYPLPMHPNAPLAHEAAWEVFTQGGSEKFWAYHDILFQNRAAMARADLERYAEQVGGINMARFRQALDTRRHQERVEQDAAAVREAGARIGTPSFFINGQLVQGAQPFPAFKAAIDRALEEG